MKKFLVKLFIKNREDVSDREIREKYGKLAGAVGIVVNLLLAAFKIGVGLIFSSIAAVADGINNLSDMASSVITLVGFHMAGKPPDREHPYGHARIEYILALAISNIILVAGAFLLYASVLKILSPGPLDFSEVTAFVISAAILVKLWLSKFYISISEDIDSVALKAAGIDSRNDVFASSAVLMSLLAGKFLQVQTDGYAGALVALFIIYSGISLIRETITPLIGGAVNPKVSEDIERLIRTYPEILNVHDLIVHDYGPGMKFASIHIEVDADEDPILIHDIADNIEQKVLKTMGIYLTVHTDPVEKDDPLRQDALDHILRAMENIEGVIDVHDVRVVKGKTHHNVIFDAVVDFDCKTPEEEIKARFARYLSDANPMYRTVITIDRDYGA